MIAGMSGGASAAAPDPDRPGREDAAPPPQAPPPAEADGPPHHPDRPVGSARTHADFLITSDERAAAEVRLRQAVADEVLSLEEYGDRMRLLLAARTRGELHAAVADLPTTARPAAGGADARDAASPAPEPRPAARPRVREGPSAIAVLGNAEISGRWRPGPSTSAVAVLGEAKVDLQGVEHDGDELVISAVAALGSVEIIVPEGVDVDMRGIAVLGERTNRADSAVLEGAPVVRIDGLALLGEVTVRHPKPSERLDTGDGRGAFAGRVPLPSAERIARDRSRRRAARFAALRRWAAGLFAAAALALPLAWTVSADDVAGALFGSTTQTVSAAEVAATDNYSVGVPVAFGSVEIQVPEGVNVERDGVVVFGSTDCGPCGADVAGAPTVQIRTAGAFGSVDVVRVPAAGGG